MKKLLLSISAIFAATSLMAQYDLEAILTTPAEGAIVAPSASQQFAFNIKNNGPNALVQGDTLWFCYTIGTTNYTMTGVSGQVSGSVLTQAFASGATTTTSANPLSLNTSAITTSTQVCGVVIGKGQAALAGAQSGAGDPNDTNKPNNLSCFTVTPSSASLTEASELSVSVYPNPASDVLNIKSEEVVKSVVLYTLDGKVVYTGNATSIDVTGLNAGTYAYIVTTLSGATSIGNFIKN